MTLFDDLVVLEKNGFKLLPYKLARNEDEVMEMAKKIGYPIAMKIVSSDVEHKTDVGGVKIDIRTPEVLLASYRQMMSSIKGKIDGVLIQKMARKGVELIVGGKKDPQFGHMVVVGMGGIYVEIFRDISARICPVEQKDVEEMISELKSHPLLEGARGKKPINKKALTELVIKTSRFMVKEDIKEMDLNPVVIDEDGFDIVDARFKR